MRVKIDLLEAKMHGRTAAGEPLENNPKTTLDSIRGLAEVLYFNPEFQEYQAAPGRWRIRRR
ncbi:MAG: hypothetical protein M3N56_12760 [Actinomycetota bacterium]|nr:hypothetical protein [Actinomycetota bacterium]